MSELACRFWHELGSKLTKSWPNPAERWLHRPRAAIPRFTGNVDYGHLNAGGGGDGCDVKKHASKEPMSAPLS